MHSKTNSKNLIFADTAHTPAVSGLSAFFLVGEDLTLSNLIQ